MSDMEAIISSAVADYKTTENITDDDSDTVDEAAEPAAEVVEDKPKIDDAVVDEPAKEDKPAAIVVPDIKDDDAIGPEKDPKGRENRIPHSRVQKIVAKAESKLKAEYEPKIAEYTTKLTAAEEKLADIVKFETILSEDHGRFLDILETLPGYKDKLVTRYGSATAATVPTTASSAVGADDPKPQPDGADGSYTQAGLDKLLDWTAAQAVKRVDEKYRPLMEDREIAQRNASNAPKVRAALAEAETWPLFNEHKAEILTALRADGRRTLETAWRLVVTPKLEKRAKDAEEATKTDRAKVREEIMTELKNAPHSTSAAPSGTKKVAVAPTGPRDITDIIKESIRGIK